MEYYDLLPIIERLDRIEKKMDKKLSDKWMNTKEVAIYNPNHPQRHPKG